MICLLFIIFRFERTALSISKAIDKTKKTDYNKNIHADMLELADKTDLESVG